MNIRDRIIEFKRVPAGELVPNSKNWRTHPKSQQDALRGILAEVGYVDAILARLLPDGRLQIVDGHLRAETTPDMEVPVLICDLNDAEADLVLATFDPLSAMAESSAQMLEALMADVQTDNPALKAMLDDLAKDAGIEGEKPAEIVEDEVPEPPADPITKPGDLWLLGAYWLCEDCGRRFTYDEGLSVKECPCTNATHPAASE